MTPRRLAPVVLVLLVAAAGWWWWPDEEDRVRAHLDAMVAAVNGRDGESELERVARVATLASGLAPDVFVDLDGRRLEDRDAVLGAARVLAGSQRVLDIQLEEVSVTIVPDHDRAFARVLARHDDDYQTLRVSLIQVDGAWLVDGVEAERPLRRPGIGAGS